MVNPKAVLVHDWLTGQRGGEKVLEVLAEIFPEAPICALFHFKGSQHPDLEKRDIRTSFLQKAPFLRGRYRYYLPLFPLAVEMFDLREFDLVISTSHCVAKGAIPRPDALHISYIHSPMRYAWTLYFSYFSPDRLSLFPRLIIPPAIHRLRIWDESSSARVDHFVANSANVARRIEKYYRRGSDVIPPPVDTDFFRPDESVPNGDYFLSVSALVPYKRLELAVEVFTRTGAPLKIVGKGPEYKELRKMAGRNVEFLGSVGAEDLRALYRGARAFLLPGEEDFGIATLEAQACGTPVIALGRGGSLETVVPGVTGLLFFEATVEGLRTEMGGARGPVVISEKRIRLIGLFVLSDSLAILVSYFYSYLFRFYAYIIPVDPARGIPPLKSYIAVFPLFLVLHLGIFYLQGFYKSKLRRARIDDFLYVCINGVLTILISFSVLNYLYNYSQGQAPIYRMTFKMSHGFLAVYFVSVIFIILIFRTQIYFFMKRRYARGLNLTRVLVVGAGDMGKSVAEKLAIYRDLGIQVIGFVDEDLSPGTIVETAGDLRVLGPLSGIGRLIEEHGRRSGSWTSTPSTSG